MDIRDEDPPCPISDHGADPTELDFIPTHLRLQRQLKVRI
jgi:hypothetical protein